MTPNDRSGSLVVEIFHYPPDDLILLGCEVGFVGSVPNAEKRDKLRDDLLLLVGQPEGRNVRFVFVAEQLVKRYLKLKRKLYSDLQSRLHCARFIFADGGHGTPYPPAKLRLSDPLC